MEAVAAEGDVEVLEVAEVVEEPVELEALAAASKAAAQ